MKLTSAIDAYVADMRQQGRFTSERTVTSYRAALERHADTVGNRDPRTIGREDVKRTLAYFSHPNTQRRNRSMMVSFYDWLMEEGLRKDNPARQTRAARPRAPQIYRLTIDETRRFLEAARGTRERRVAFLGVCAGLRREELRLLQGRHFARPGWVWVSADIAKGGHERWVPVLADLREVVEEIRGHVHSAEFAVPAQQFADPPRNREVKDYPERPPDGKSIWRLTQKIGRRAGLAVPVNPHMMRHAFADHIARLADVRTAQQMLGHADISTTQGYLGKPTLDELAAAVADVSFGLAGYPVVGGPANPVMETVGIEPTVPTFRALERLFASPALREAARSMA